jgi:hypothetical protein
MVMDAFDQSKKRRQGTESARGNRTNTQRAFFGVEAFPSCAVESPAVQRTDQFIAIDHAEDGKVSVAVGACALDDPAANLNFFFGNAASVRIGFAQRFGLSSDHSFF